MNIHAKFTIPKLGDQKTGSLGFAISSLFRVYPTPELPLGKRRTKEAREREHLESRERGRKPVTERFVDRYQ
jgi:hypothetical protein